METGEQLEQTNLVEQVIKRGVIIEPFDPVIKEVVSGREKEIREKTVEIINASGIALIPDSVFDNPVKLLTLGDMGIQAFSSTIEDDFHVSLTALGEHSLQRPINQQLLVGKKPFLLSVLFKNLRQKDWDIFYLYQPLKGTILKKLKLELRNGEIDETEFEYNTRDILTRNSVDYMRGIIDLYLESEVNLALSNKKYRDITRSISSVGYKEIRKLY